jgi:hypothetical protein
VPLSFSAVRARPKLGFRPTSTITCSSSVGLSFGAISSTLWLWSSKVAAIDGFGHVLGHGPAQPVRVKHDSEAIRHDAGIIFRQRASIAGARGLQRSTCGAMKRTQSTDFLYMVQRASRAEVLPAGSCRFAPEAMRQGKSARESVEFRSLAMPHVPVHELPDSSMIKEDPVRNAFGGQVIGSTARLRRLTLARESPLKSIK